MLEIAVLWLINERSELLLAKRALDKASDPGTWGPTVTGRAEPGETPDQTLTREAEEELDLKQNDYKPIFLFTIDFNHPDGRARRFNIYFASIEREITRRLRIDAKEVAAVTWLPIGKVKELLVTGSDEFKLVPSAKAVWPKTFEMLETNQYVQSGRAS